MEEIRVKYFGEIAEKTGLTEEFIVLETLDTASILTFLNTRYDIDITFLKIAVNQELITKNSLLTSQDDIAILSPFAGG